MIKRHIADELTHLLGEYPVVTLLGPRQAGKTTLARELINSRPKTLEPYDYSNLETPEIRQFAIDDPKAFLA
ncbi:MAG: AAA family ATPase, partial [Exilibacterium sp.]